MKYLEYFSFYTNEGYEIKIDSEELSLHYRFFEILNYLLDKVDANNVLRINIILSDDKNKNLQQEKTGNILDVIFYLDVKKLGKDYKSIINTYRILFIKLFENNKWKIEKFMEIIQSIDTQNFQLKKALTRKLFNSSKSESFQLFFELRTDNIVDIYLSLGDRNKALLKMGGSLFIKSHLKSYIHKTSWSSDTEIKIIQSNKKDYWIYNINTNELNFHFSRAENGDAHGQYDLALMYLNGQGVLKNEEKGIYWLKKSANKGFKRAKKMIENFDKKFN